MEKIYPNAAAALSGLLFDGMTIMSGGFGLTGNPEKLIAATEEVVEKKPDGVAHYKEAVNCKACHSEHKGD